LQLLVFWILRDFQLVNAFLKLFENYYKNINI